MYEDTYMYAIERSPEYLAHYGVRGMRWGVRRALKSGNERRLNRQFNKAQKKLNKLVKQSQNTAKYRKRAALMGVGAAAAGGLAAAGTTGVGSLLRKSARVVTPGAKAVGAGLSAGGKAIGNLANAIPGKQLGMSKLAGRMSAAGRRISSNANNAGQAMRGAGNSVIAWGTKNTLGKAAGHELYKVAGGPNEFNKNLVKLTGNNVAGYEQKLGRVSNNTIARIGAGAIGAGLAAGAARNAYKAATAQKREAKFRSEMQKAFKGTKYANQISGGQNRSSQPRQGKKRRRNG